MSGHCPKCGDYTEEDESRLCSGCAKSVPLAEMTDAMLAERVWSGDRWTYPNLASLRARLAEAEARAGRAEEAVRVLAEALVARRKFNGTKTGIEVKLNGVKCLGCGCVTFDVYGDEEPFPWEKVGHYAECPRLRVQATEKAVEQNPAARAAVEGAK